MSYFKSHDTVCSVVPAPEAEAVRKELPVAHTFAAQTGPGHPDHAVITSVFWG